jgi:hypothetical protein
MQTEEGNKWERCAGCTFFVLFVGMGVVALEASAQGQRIIPAPGEVTYTFHIRAATLSSICNISFCSFFQTFAPM